MRPAEAVDGPAALSALRMAKAAGDPFSLAILDMQMPGMDGVALGGAIRNDPQVGQTILVVMSSIGQRSDRRSLDAVAVAAYLTKPVGQAALFDRLVAALTSAAQSNGPWAAMPRDSQRAPPLPTAQLAPGRRRARVLVAEDNITNQQVALGILSKLGVTADAVANGREVLEALATTPYGLVLMDVGMPEMDGLQATRAIRDPHSDVLARNIPILAMTAHAMAGDREQCLKAGMNGYLSKPVEPRALAEAVQRWLPPSLTTSAADLSARRRGKNMEPEPASEPKAEARAVFDRAELLSRLADDEQMLRAVQQVFLEDMPKQVELLKALAARGDATMAGVQAHKIKGAAGTVCGGELRSVAAAMEKAGQGGDQDELTRLMPELERQFRLLRAAMEE